tara:strand:- start:2596 stop:2823 length:228 start_codon:yes stop_codon:yes gene_type:complete
MADAIVPGTRHSGFPVVATASPTAPSTPLLTLALAVVVALLFSRVWASAAPEAAEKDKAAMARANVSAARKNAAE